MGVSAKGELIGNVPYEIILDFIKEKYDKNAKADINKEEYDMIAHKEKYNDSDKWQITSGFICFNDGTDKRMLHYLYQNLNFYENLSYYEEYGLSEMVKSEKTSVSLGSDEKGIEIIRSIVSEFGGWFDENDCDDKEYIVINANPTRPIKEIIHVTKEELNEKFGGIVVIDD